MEIESVVAKLEARVDRNQCDIEKLINSLTATREAAAELTINMQQLDRSIRNATKTLYGNGDRKNSLVNIADVLVLNYETVHRQLLDHARIFEEIRLNSDKAVDVALKGNNAAETALNATKNFTRLVEGNVIQIGKIKLSGKAANIAAIMVIPIITVAVILSILYFILAFMDRVPWPWQ